MSEHEPRLRHTYQAFNARDLDAVLAHLHPDVDWPNMIDGGRVRGHVRVRDYWMRQFQTIDPHVEPRQFEEDEQGRVIVTVQQVVRDRTGRVVSEGQVRHVYTIREGLITRMDVEAPGLG